MFVALSLSTFSHNALWHLVRCPVRQTKNGSKAGYDYYLYLTPISRHTSRFPITWFFQ
ncbi:hypothetical protein SETIT_9G244800v2 [Setaria italica]|uniref:Uncharacterized protein n=1 Tax=Setaria italica TaxID=4555 RepID=A0A368SLY1_SETIT|nr:hypothetical protein SETIT_9G244800v2 [Setaria italica]